MPDPIRVYIDTCVFIDLLQKKPGSRYENCLALEQQARNGEIVFVTSCLTITEATSGKDDFRISGEDAEHVNDYFEQSFINLRVVDRHVAQYAQRLAIEKKLTCNDAIHIATAILHQATIFYTYDGLNVKKRSGLLKHSKKIGRPPLRIETPPDLYAGTLFEKLSHEDPSLNGFLTTSIDITTSPDGLAGMTSKRAELDFMGSVSASAPINSTNNDVTSSKANSATEPMESSTPVVQSRRRRYIQKPSDAKE